jgi:phage/plasmid-associated DNA primase
MTQLMLLDKISLNEIEGLAFKCLGILKTLTGRNFSFTNDQAITRLMEDYERVSNPFDTFISECCEITDNAFVPKLEFKERFYEWLKQKGSRLWDDKNIIEAMMKRDFNEEKRRLVIVGLTVG